MSPETREKVIDAAEALLNLGPQYTRNSGLYFERAERLRAALALLREDDGWCYDMEKAPRDGERLLLLCPTRQSTTYATVGAWREAFDDWGVEGDAWGWTDGTVGDWGMQEYERLKPTAWSRIDLPTAKESEG